MASASSSTGKKELNENISIRAIKRKRALAHYKKKHQNEKSYSLDHECKAETSYYFENGLRKVYPYLYYFKTYVKGRWFGRTLIDIYASEFKAASEDKHREEIECGNVRVNGQIVSPEFVLGNNQLVEHKCHRHECAVLDTPIEILVDTADILVINKPASIPCHPCGRYRYNSITFILEKEYGYKSLRTLYRLDRLTSGLLILPKTTTVSKKLEKQLEKKLLQKEYVSRVLGKFPDGDITCDEPIALLSQRLSLYTTDKNGKPSSTMFTRLSYNGKTSVVKCVPHTGRTHQIRVHLQHLGYPIVNDPLYNSTAFGPGKGKDGIRENSVEEIEKIIMETSNVGSWKLGNNPDYVAQFGEDGNKPCYCDTVPVERDIHHPPDGANAIQNKMDGLVNEMTVIGTMDDTATGAIRDKVEDSVDTDTSTAVSKDVSDVRVQVEGRNDSSTYDIMESTDSNSVTGEVASDLNSEMEDSANIKEAEEITCDNVEDIEKHDEGCRGKGPDQKVPDSHGDLDKETKVSGKSCEDSPGSEANTDRNVESPVAKRMKLDERVDTNIETDSSLSNTASFKCDISADPNKESEGDKMTSVVHTFSATERSGLDKRKLTVDRNCEYCKSVYTDPTPNELIIYLHAVQYKGPDWEYSTSLPYWAEADFTDEDIRQDYVPELENQSTSEVPELEKQSINDSTI